MCTAHVFENSIQNIKAIAEIDINKINQEINTKIATIIKKDLVLEIEIENIKENDQDREILDQEIVDIEKEDLIDILVHDLVVIINIDIDIFFMYIL